MAIPALANYRTAAMKNTAFFSFISKPSGSELTAAPASSIGKSVQGALVRSETLMRSAGMVATLGASLLPDTEGKMYLAFRLKCFFVNLLDDQSNIVF
jgi:hypothetical protein